VVGISDVIDTAGGLTMNQYSQREAKRDISSVNFIVTLTGLEIDTILTAVGVTTSMWAKNRRQMPGSFDLALLCSGCDKLTNPVEEDYQQRCASHSDFQSERDKVLELLNDLRKYANGEYKEADLSDNEHDLRIHLEYENRIWGIMKELRAGEL
jgi:hypothetical protein